MEYEVLGDGRIANSDGYIAVRYRQTIQKYIKVGSREYIFSVQNNISLAWIHPDDVERVLRLTKTCCGGSVSSVTTICDETHVKRWLGIAIW